MSGATAVAATATGGELKLTIKAANQKFSDFVIDSCQLDWSVKRLKQHLSDNYPKNPDIRSIRLIYSGKMLNDSLTLKECIRHNTEVTNHIIHMVHSSNNASANSKQSTNMLNQSRRSTNNTSLNDTDLDIENELTPNNSTSSSDSSDLSNESSEESTETSSTPINVFSQSNANMNAFNQLQANITNAYRLQQQSQQQMTEKERYDQILNGLRSYYESFGIQIQSNPWYSSYIQQLALYSHMHSNYIQSISSNFSNFIPVAPFMSNIRGEELQSSSQTGLDPSGQQQAQLQQEQPQQQQQQAAEPPQRNVQANNNNDFGEREDDWLSMLHNIVSFMVLFSIIYYYSSVERFLIIFAIVFLLILYHNGWLSLQRRPVANNNVNINARPRQNNEQAQQNQNGNNPNNNNPGSDNDDVTPQPHEQNESDSSFLTQEEEHRQQNTQSGPNFFRVVFTFVLTFFTSLIPERPQGIAN